MTKVRMEWTMDEFFQEGGTTAFIDRLCASLGIHASTVKVVGVNAGSVIVNYEITPDEEEPLSLEQIKTKQAEQIATGTLELGAPILDASDGGESIIEDGVVVADGFAKVVLVKTASNAGQQIWYDWLEPMLWESAQIVAVDTPSVMIYEGLFLALQWFWDNLRKDVKDMADDYFKGLANQATQDKINHDDHVVNTVPEETETLDNGQTQGIGEEDNADGL